MGASADVEGHSMIISFVLEVLRARCCCDTPHPDVPPPACMHSLLSTMNATVAVVSPTHNPVKFLQSG